MKRFLYKAIPVLVLAFVLCACGHESYFEDSGQVPAKNEAKVSVKSGAAEQQSSQKAQSSKIYVQVAGAVKKPGVYELKAGSRVFAAIELAGGLSKNADDSDLNQATSLEDGQKIYIPVKGERESEESAASSDQAAEASSDGRVNINLADVEQLKTLTGIGDAKAQAVISYRESNGGFSRPEDIMNVDGIAEGTYQKIKDKITI